MLGGWVLARASALAFGSVFCRVASIRQLAENVNSLETKFSPPRSSRVYGCGVVVTGAIGIKKYVEPDGTFFIIHRQIS